MTSVTKYSSLNKFLLEKCKLAENQCSLNVPIVSAIFRLLYLVCDLTPFTMNAWWPGEAGTQYFHSALYWNIIILFQAICFSYINTSIHLKLFSWSRVLSFGFACLYICLIICNDWCVCTLMHCLTLKNIHVRPAFHNTPYFFLIGRCYNPASLSVTIAPHIWRRLPVDCRDYPIPEQVKGRTILLNCFAHERRESWITHLNTGITPYQNTGLPRPIFELAIRSAICQRCVRFTSSYKGRVVMQVTL